MDKIQIKYFYKNNNFENIYHQYFAILHENLSNVSIQAKNL